MKVLSLLLVASAFVHSVLLWQFLWLCPFLGVSKEVTTAAGMGAAVIFVITSASSCTSLIYQFVLKGGLEFLQTIAFILVIAALVQFVELVLKKTMPALYRSLGVYLPLITTNCAVLGVALTNVQSSYGFVESVVNGFGTAVGFTVAIVILAGIRERIARNNIPQSFQGMPITLAASGLMAIAFYGFAGML